MQHGSQVNEGDQTPVRSPQISGLVQQWCMRLEIAKVDRPSAVPVARESSDQVGDRRLRSVDRKYPATRLRKSVRDGPADSTGGPRDDDAIS
mgnify:CR=1 FL=1